MNGFNVSFCSDETVTNRGQTTVEGNNQGVAQIKRWFGDAKIRHTTSVPLKLSVYDIIKAVTLSRNTRATYVRSRVSEERHEYQQFRGLGERPTPVIPLDEVPTFVSKLVAGARMSTKQIQGWVTKLGCSIETIVHMRTGPIECDTLEIIEQSFKMLECKKQYGVLEYRVDMYIPEYNICIECDEDGHQRYDYDKEIERQERITQALMTPSLPVRWVRYNPHDPEFSIGNVINNVLQCIGCFRKSASMTNAATQT